MRHITPDQREEILRAWRLYGKQRAVALAVGVDRKTAGRWKPGSNRSSVTEQGYSTWSEAARRRWDEFWSQPMCVSRLAERFHLRIEREGE